MKKLFLLFMLFSSPILAQQQASYSNPQGGNISASGATCATVNACIWQKLPITASATTVTITVPVAFTGTLLIETSADGGNTFSTQSTQTGAVVVTITTTSLTDVRVRCSAFTSGSAAVNIQTAGNQLNVTSGGGGGGITSVSILPATCTPGQQFQLTGSTIVTGCGPAANQFFITTDGLSIDATGLIGFYQALPGDTVASLKDYSGQGNNATGTAGTAPTIVAGTGGLNCTQNGAVLLPAALNSAATIVQSVGWQPSGQTLGFYSPFIGNGTPATSGVGLVIQKLTTASLATNFGTLANNFSGGGVLYTNSAAYVAGISDIALVSNPGFDQLYNNGSAVAQNQTGVTSGKMTSGVYSICGAAAGAGNSSQTYWNGQVYVTLVYNVVKTNAQISAIHYALQPYLQARGITPLPYRNDTGDFIWAYGDSTTLGSGFISWPSRVVGLNGTWSVGNIGINGTTAAQLLGFAPQSGYSTCSTAGGRSAIVLLTGANDASAPPVYGNARGILSSLKFPQCSRLSTILSTMMDKNTGSAMKNAYNLLVRTNCRTTADYCIDLGGTVALGADGAATNLTYFNADQLHPTQAGADVLTWVFQRGINRFHGNLDFSTATTYVAAAAAATAVTATSEAGNVMTFTTTLNPPLGSCVITTGITPANYNSTFANSAGLGCWYVLSTSGTTFTAWNQTSGLGVGTVFGTAVVPQQKDADQTVILNFGAGNFTMQSCEGLTINDVTRIKNINAVASTVVPFGTQTIDGAATVTVASKATLVLQPQLVSPAAGGCNWLQLQNN